MWLSQKPDRKNNENPPTTSSLWLWPAQRELCSSPRRRSSSCSRTSIFSVPRRCDSCSKMVIKLNVKLIVYKCLNFKVSLSRFMKICLHLHIIDLSQRGNSFYPCLYTHTYNQPLICASVCVCVPSDLLHIVLRLHVLIFLCMCVCQCTWNVC